MEKAISIVASPYGMVDGEEYRHVGGKNLCERDMENVGMNMANVIDRTKWKRGIQNY